MNANENSPKAGFRLKRIQTVSRIVRYLVLGLFIFTIGYHLRIRLLSPIFTKGTLVHTALVIPLEAILCLWYWKLAKLFHFYERGLIFSTETIHCIKTLGLLCVINWLLMSALHIAGQLFPPPPPPTLPPGVTVTVVKSSFSMGFFSFSIAGINVGLLLAGAVIILIAWIMDEGRKIQEEQELTV